MQFVWSLRATICQQVFLQFFTLQLTSNWSGVKLWSFVSADKFYFWKIASNWRRLLVKQWLSLKKITSNLSSTAVPLICRTSLLYGLIHFPYLNPCWNFPFSLFFANLIELKPSKILPKFGLFLVSVYKVIKVFFTYLKNKLAPTSLH